ncbi:hypothetical protein CHUAL_009694 [Chamberlinius hualienensis]
MMQKLAHYISLSVDQSLDNPSLTLDLEHNKKFKPTRRKITRKPLLVKTKVKQRKLDKSKNLPPINIKVELQGSNENLDERSKETFLFDKKKQ